MRWKECDYRFQSYRVMFFDATRLPLHLGKPLCALRCCQAKDVAPAASTLEKHTLLLQTQKKGGFPNTEELRANYCQFHFGVYLHLPVQFRGVANHLKGGSAMDQIQLWL